MALENENTVAATKRDKAPVGNNTAATRAAVQDNWNKLWADRMQQSSNGNSGKWVVTSQVTVSDYDLGLKVRSEIEAVMTQNGLSDEAIINMRPMR